MQPFVTPDSAVLAAGQATIGGLLSQQVRMLPEALAVQDARVSWTYQQFNNRVNKLANALASTGVGRGDRISVLSENRCEYLELEFAAARLGALVAALNWRLSEDELSYCLQLAEPKIGFVSPRFKDAQASADYEFPQDIVAFGEPYEALLTAASNREPQANIDPEDGLVILYTSGTTGRPKGAVISQRAFISRLTVFCADYGVARGDTFPAWAPMFHMASTDMSIGTLLLGGKVVQIDGFDLETIMSVVSSDPVSWLVMMPGVIDRTIDFLQSTPIVPKGIRVMGAMADLIPLHQIAELTERMATPYLNSFGATETGIPPASGNMIPIGVVPDSLSKSQSSFCEIRLVGQDDQEVRLGEPGDLAIRGPTVFSGYWRAPDVNAKDFRGGWFHMGDMFKRNADGTLDFVDRAKYLIKSGGENIYPAEIERVLLEDARTADAVVVRRADDRWGEVPVAVVARNDDSLSAQTLIEYCRDKLAHYKQPKEIVFVELEDLPRSTTGKIQRHEVEAMLKRVR